MGGEKLLPSDTLFLELGSPPRRRGIVVHKLNGRIIPGITPAWAGKSMTAPGRSSRTGDHPRMGGEKLYAPVFAQYRVGSPPRGRGKETRPDIYRQLSRITPARAGKRLTAQSQASAMAGSPPHGRGKDSVMYCLQGVHGITPAWAGKSCSNRRCSGCHWDHPRVGGEKLFQSPLFRLPLGSPPRGRGKAFYKAP